MFDIDAFFEGLDLETHPDGMFAGSPSDDTWNRIEEILAYTREGCSCHPDGHQKFRLARDTQ